MYSIAPRDRLTSGSWTTTSRNPWSSSHKLADDPQRSLQTEYTLRDSDDPGLVIARGLIVSNTRQGYPGPTHIMFNGQLLGDVLEIPFAHPLESIPDILLDKLIFFL